MGRDGGGGGRDAGASASLSLYLSISVSALGKERLELDGAGRGPRGRNKNKNPYSAPQQSITQPPGLSPSGPLPCHPQPLPLTLPGSSSRKRCDENPARKAIGREILYMSIKYPHIDVYV